MLQRLLNARSSLRPHGWTSARTFESYSSVAGAPRLCSFGTVCARSYTWDPPAQPLFFKFKGCHHFCRSHVVMRIAAAVRNTGVVSNSHGWVPGLAEQFWFKVAPRSTKLGHRTTSMRRSWTFWRFSSWPVQCRGKISCRTMWPVCCSSWPRNPQRVTLWMRLGKPCGVGNWVIGGGVSLGGLVGRPMPGAPSLIMGGKIMWVLLGATESEMEFIPKPCPICCSPCFSHCLFCCHKICGECNFIRTFCPFCAGSGSD